jgi:hypothetical protein
LIRKEKQRFKGLRNSLKTPKLCHIRDIFGATSGETLEELKTNMDDAIQLVLNPINAEAEAKIIISSRINF